MSDDIVDAEIVDDDDMLPVLAPSREVDDITQVVDRLPPGALDLLADPDVLAIPMDSAMRAQVRQALAFYWNNGPRQRNTLQCQRAMDRIYEVESSTGHCATCGGAGHWNDRLGKRQVCSCPAALQSGHGS
jgi:hypothetical protein